MDAPSVRRIQTNVYIHTYIHHTGKIPFLTSFHRPICWIVSGWLPDGRLPASLFAALCPTLLCPASAMLPLREVSDEQAAGGRRQTAPYARSLCEPCEACKVYGFLPHTHISYHREVYFLGTLSPMFLREEDIERLRNTEINKQTNNKIRKIHHRK
jgi:hypothetical protein